MTQVTEQGRSRPNRVAPNRITPGRIMPNHITSGRITPGRVPGNIFLAFALVGVFSLTVIVGCDRSDDGNELQKVNGSVHVVAGKAPSAAETVNGGINIDDDAAVTAANTVNGGIHLGAHATADTLNTVNGSITIGAGAHVAKHAESVNGGVSLRDGAEVLGTVGNVNGKIELTGAHVAAGIKTVNGDIAIFGASQVEGGILVQKTNELIHFGSGMPRIEIGPGATVQGDLRFEREVKLYVSDKATIGPVTGATPIAFTGNTPPQG
jgi:DUF4097 and DUF4098 domain-containing protein YvlB